MIDRQGTREGMGSRRKFVGNFATGALVRACLLRAMSFCTLLLLASATATPLAAADSTAEKPDIWIVTLGGWGVLEPRFEGAKHDTVNFRPLFNIRKEGAKEWLVLPNDGFDFEFIETSNFRAGPVANWHWQRSVTGDIPRGYKHFGSVDLSIEGGAFAEFWPTDALRTRAELRHSVIGGKGMVADFSADAVWRPVPAMTVTAGPRLSLADSDFMHAYYNVDPALSGARGWPVYDAKAGLRSFGAGSMIKYAWSNQWTTMAFVEYQRLAGSAGDSPIIDLRGTENQVSVGLGASYTFSLGR